MNSAATLDLAASFTGRHGVHRRSMVLAVVGGILVACGGSAAVDPVDDAASETVDQDDGSTPREEPDDEPSGSQGESGADATMSFTDFHARAQELVGQQVSVGGRVLFDLTCPPPDQPDQDCIAEAQLVDPAVQDLSETAEVVPLFEGDKTIACTAETANNLECRGLRDGQTYVVDARVDERTGYGVVLEVRSSRSTG